MSKPYRCPLLGLMEDPGTSLDFPSSGNYCHHRSPAEKVQPTHQRRFCLSENHTACPIYQSAQTKPAIPVTASSPVRNQSRRIAAAIGIPIIALLVMGSAALTDMKSAWIHLSQLLQSRAQVGFNAAGGFEMYQVPGSGDAPARQMPLQHNEASPQNLDPGAERATKCPLPEGWVQYTVNPTDSLFRLSVLHGITIEELQRMNCLDASTVILPGQVIFIPARPTHTPSPTLTATMIFPTWTFTPRPAFIQQPSSTPVMEEEKVVDPPTAVPPTTVPPTDVPPTEVPPTAVPPTRIPPTDSPTNTPNPPEKQDDKRKDEDKGDNKDKDEDKGKKEDKGKDDGKGKDDNKGKGKDKGDKDNKGKGGGKGKGKN